MDNVILPIFCCLYFLDYSIMAMYTDLNIHLQNVQSLYLRDYFITWISILSCLDFKWRFQIFFLLGYSLNISWKNNVTFNVPLKHKSVQRGKKLAANCNEISGCIFVHNVRVRHIITLNSCQKNVFAAVSWSLAVWIDKENKSRTGKNMYFSP